MARPIPESDPVTIACRGATVSWGSGAGVVMPVSFPLPAPESSAATGVVAARGGPEVARAGWCPDRLDGLTLPTRGGRHADSPDPVGRRSSGLASAVFRVAGSGTDTYGEPHGGMR
ncbi:hypothetical protein GCM10023223_08500 [Stackebrandtia albiflava]